MFHGKIKRKFVITYIFLLMMVTGYLSADETDQPIIKMTAQEISIDGVYEDSEWQDAKLFNILYETKPGVNVPAPVKTDVFITYSNTHLLVCFKAFDPDYSKIRANLSDRDHLTNDDQVYIMIDTFNDGRMAFFLGSNPRGVQSDYRATPAGWDESWDAIYDSAGQIYDWGYVVELAIPFSSIQFQRTEEEQIWGLMFNRVYPRDVSRELYSRPLDPNIESEISQYEKVKGFAKVSPGRNIEITPTITSFNTQVRKPFPDGEYKTLDSNSEAGVTARWGVTPNLNLSATINPDFSQVEADAPQLDINEPFALQFAEKRPFFTQGSENMLNHVNVVYTRTLRDPEWGLKLTGREGDYTIGAFVVEDNYTNFILPGSQRSRAFSTMNNNTSTVVKINRDLANYSSIGVLMTNRQNDDYHNRVYGVDGLFRVTNSDRITTQILKSDTQYEQSMAAAFNQPTEEFSGSLVDVQYLHQTKNIQIIGHYQEIGDDFRADLGFMPKVGYTKKAAAFTYTTYAKPDDFWTILQTGSTVHHFEDQEGNLLKKDINLRISLFAKKQSLIQIMLKKEREGFMGEEFDKDFYLGYFGFRPIPSLMVESELYFGNVVDYTNVRLADRFKWHGAMEWNIGSQINFVASHLFEDTSVDDVDLYTANISQLYLKYHFSDRLFFKSILQYYNYDYNVDNYLVPMIDSFEHLFSQLLISYKLNARTVFYIGYSDNYFQDWDSSLQRKDYTVFAKIGYAWVL